MNREVAKAHADTLQEWAIQYVNDGTPGATEVAFLLGRAMRMCRAIANDEPVVVPEEPKVEEPISEVRED